MTIGRGRFGWLNVALLAGRRRSGWPLRARRGAGGVAADPAAMFRDPALSAGLATSALVTTVVMATLVVGPFYLSRALGLDAARVGLVMSVGPVVAALTGVPAGRLVDRLGAGRVTVAGLAGMAVGAVDAAAAPARLGVRRLRRAAGRRHRRLRAVPGGQQHRRHGGRPRPTSAASSPAC